MPRKPRLSFEGALYHVNTRGNRRADIFLDTNDRDAFLAILLRAARKAGWRCHAYCLMTNHYHLLLETPEPTISEGMQLLNGQYARAFNERYGLKGHLFEQRFYDEAIESQEHLLEVSRYVVLNPVRARICNSAAQWPWSSYLATAGWVGPPRFLTVDWTLSLFGGDPEQARARYARFVADGAASNTSGARHRTRPDQPTPYTPGKRSASTRTSNAAGRPTTLR